MLNYFLLLIRAAIRCVEVSGCRRCKNYFITEVQAGSRSYREMREIVSSAASRSLYTHTHIYVTSLSGASQPAAAADDDDAAAAVGFVTLPDPVWPQRESLFGTPLCCGKSLSPAGFLHL